MLFRHLAVILLAGASYAHTEITRPRCGNDVVSQEDIDMAEKLVKLQHTRKELGLDLSRHTQRSFVTVELHMHYVTWWSNMNKRMEKRLTNQANVLNKAFRPYGINFSPIEIHHYNSKAWGSGADEFAMKKKLRKGDYRTLNIYFVDDSFIGGQKDILGRCTLPNADASTNHTRVIEDGCIVWSDTIPGMPHKMPVTWDLGYTAVHEVGHWFGLLHPWQGGCHGGDLVADTPPSAGPLFGCQIGSQTCGRGKPDPIHNFMSYSYDACMSHFTPGQADRMVSSWVEYRMLPKMLSGSEINLPRS